MDDNFKINNDTITVAKLSDDTLLKMAGTAFDVINWARRMGLKKDQQLAEVVKGFKADLKEGLRST